MSQSDTKRLFNFSYVPLHPLLPYPLTLSPIPLRVGPERLTLPDDDQVEDAEVSVDDAAADGFAFALSGATWPVARVTLAEQQTHTAVGQNTLLHGEALLIISSTDAHNVALTHKHTEVNYTRSCHRHKNTQVHHRSECGSVSVRPVMLCPDLVVIRFVAPLLL